MIKHKKTIIFLRNISVIAGIWVLFLPPFAHAQDYILQQQVIDPNPPATDVCLNIPGVQSAVPSGMQVDQNGSCYTPSTPPTPVTTDLCNNLAGTQTTLPSGYYRTTAGNCYTQVAPPAAPIDVCTNLDGTQSILPEGYYLATDNTCQPNPTPVDVCPNIPGPQETVPTDMRIDNGICYTPTKQTDNTPGTNTTTPSGPGTTTKTSLKNVPEPLQPVAQFFANLVPEATKQWLKSLPADVARTVPYYVFIMVAILALIPILQSLREALFVRQLAILLKREREIAEQKNNFVTLASHYLRTPLTLMKSGLDTIVALGEVTAEAVEPLKFHLDKLDVDLSSILQNVESNTELKNISDPIASTHTPSVWRSPWFWGPIILSIILTVLANFLLSVVGDKEIGITDSFFQFLVAAIAFIILYLGVRNMHLQKKLRDENQALIDHERAIDKARNVFIANTSTVLQDSLEPMQQSRIAIQDAPSARFFDEGYQRIESILERFLLLGQVQAGADRNLETFDLHEAIDNLLVTYHAAISEKRLTVANMTSTTFIKQNRLLFNFVLGSILDNAIKFNQEGGSIEISAEPNSRMLSLKVSDNGIGIDSDKLGQLFKPFSRATSAVEFNYEGLGFSLFLDKIIMDYTGGNIAATSAVNEGTQLLVTTPLATNA